MSRLAQGSLGGSRAARSRPARAPAPPRSRIWPLAAVSGICSVSTRASGPPGMPSGAAWEPAWGLRRAPLQLF